MCMQAPTAALERFFTGRGGPRGGSQSTLAASIDSHLAALSSTRDSCSAELGSMQAILDRLVVEVCGHFRLQPASTFGPS